MLIQNSSIPNLLVTDDDSAFRSVLCEGLSRRGFKVTEAGDGMEAIELIERSEVHVCLIDFHMPRLNGVEVIRAHPAKVAANALRFNERRFRPNDPGSGTTSICLRGAFQANPLEAN